MKGAIVFTTKYGSTRQYAQWLRDETGFDLYSVDDRTRKAIREADVVIVGSPIRAGRLVIARWFQRNWASLKTKRVLLYSVGLLHAEDDETKLTWERSLPKHIRASVRHFPFGGRFVLDQLRLVDRILVRSAASIGGDPEVRQGILRGIDRVDRMAIRPLLDYVKQLAAQL